MKRRDKFTELEILLARCAITFGLPDEMRKANLAAFIVWLNEEIE